MNPVKSIIQTVRGMHDILPERAKEYLLMETKARSFFSLYGYKEIRTPILESLSLFERALGETTDIVEKEMFTLKDRGDRDLCLRPEGTAGVVRAFIENSFGEQSPIVKMFYIGPMFRAERPQKGRLREFAQIGSEYFGNDSPSADAETIHLTQQILLSAGVPSLEIQLNSLGCPVCRPAYLELLLNFLKKQSLTLCRNCQHRIKKNPLRVLDCKEDSVKISDVPRSEDSLCENCLRHHEEVKKLLRSTQTEFRPNPRLVRGLDYYTGTVFEVYASGQTGSQDALAAGGRYDTLVEELGGKKVPAVGFALGMERVLNQLNLCKRADDKSEILNDGVFVAAIGKEVIEKSFQILTQLRTNSIPAEGVLNEQSLKSQLRLADKLRMRFCIMLGENELKEGVVTFKNLSDHSQEKIPMQQLIETVRRKMRE